jgi:hypothetical protein
MGFQPWVNRHPKMRPESGARIKRRARMISIRYGVPEYVGAYTARPVTSLIIITITAITKIM